MKCPQCGTENDGQFCTKRGAPINDTAPNSPNQNETPNAPQNAVPYESKFTAGAFNNFFVQLWAGFICLITLGLVYPVTQCWLMR